MKKSVSTSLALAALALAAAGGIALLGGPNFLTVLSNIKSPSKTKIEEPPLEEKEAVSEDKQEEIDQNGKEIALEAKAQVEQPTPKKEKEEVKKESKARAEIVPQTEPKIAEQKTEKSTFTAPKIPPNATQKKSLGNGKYTLTFPRGETVEYNEHGIPTWSSWQGRLTETEEEKRWKDNYSSPLKGRGSGRDGTGKWCLTPAKNYEVEDVHDCPLKVVRD